MKRLNDYLNEGSKIQNEIKLLNKSEKFWDAKFKKAINLFPEWKDEKIVVTNSIRKAYNEMVIDVVKGDKGYVEMPGRTSNKIHTKFAEDMWTKLKGNEWAKKYALEDHLGWLK